MAITGTPNVNARPLVGSFEDVGNADIIHLKGQGGNVVYRLNKFQAIWYVGVGNPDEIPGALTNNLYIDSDTGNIWYYSGAAWSKVDDGGVNETVSLKLPLCLSQQAPIQYVDSANGDDTNDGCSWGSAKKYAKTAWLALYNSTGLLGRTHGGGTIYFTDTGNGLMWDAAGSRAAIIGPNDPNWVDCPSSPCTINGISWVIQASIAMIGVGCTGLAQSGLGPGSAACFTQFGTNDPNNPSVGMQISGTNASMLFDGVAIINVDIPLEIGVDSNGSSSSNDNTAGLTFKNFMFMPRDGCGTPQTTQQGPAIWMGYTFEDYFFNGVISGCGSTESWQISSVSRSAGVSEYTTSTAHHLVQGNPVFIAGVADSTFNLTAARIASVPDDLHFTISQAGPDATSSGGTVFGPGSAAVLMDSAGGFGAGLIGFHNTHFNGGGIKYTGTNGGSGITMDADSLSEDLVTNDALVWMRGFNFAGQNVGGIDGSNADSGSNVAEIRNASSQSTEIMLMGSAFGGGAYGLGIGAPATQGEAGVEASGGTGFFADKLFGRYDDWRHGGPYVHLYANLVSTVPTNWSGATVSGVPGPFAIQTGGDTSAGSVTGQKVLFGSVSKTLNNGDWVIAKGMWSFLEIGAPASLTAPFNILLSGGGCAAQLVDPRDSNVMSSASAGLTFGQTYSQVGSWESSGALLQVYSPSGSSTCTIDFYGLAATNGGNNTIAYFNPTLQVVPNEDLDFLGVAQMAMYEPPFSSACPAGALCIEAPNLMSLGNNTGFGNGSAGIGVTTTAQGSGTGPATPQTVVKYLEIDIQGTKFWLPLVQ